MATTTEQIGAGARNFFDKMLDGARSGLNRQSLGRVFGTSQLASMGARGAAAAKHGWTNKGAIWGGANADGNMTKIARGEALGHAKSLGSQALHWGSGGGYKGWARAGAAGARLAGAAVAVNVADFLNPFGFGSIDD